jgi:hypothetical protein
MTARVEYMTRNKSMISWDNLVRDSDRKFVEFQLQNLMEGKIDRMVNRIASPNMVVAYFNVRLFTHEFDFPPGKPFCRVFFRDRFGESYVMIVHFADNFKGFRIFKNSDYIVPF